MKCTICEGVGVFIVYNTELGRHEVQRCDHCKQFKSDEDAWKYLQPR